MAIALVALVVGVVGERATSSGSCGGGGGSGGAASGQKIDVIIRANDSAFWQTMLAGAEKAGQDFGIKIGKFGPTSETNIDEQVRRNAPALSYLAPLLFGESVTEGTATR